MLSRLSPSVWALALLATAQLSCGTELAKAPPARILPGPSASVPLATPPKLVQLASSPMATCGAADDGSVWCWGRLPRGAVAVPTRVKGLDDVVEVQGAFGAHCARHRTGKVSCWGWGLPAGSDGGTMTDGFWRAPVDHAVQIAVSSKMGCALRESGRVACWGDIGSFRGQRFWRDKAHDVLLRGRSTKIAAGRDTTCALVETTLWCWAPWRAKPHTVGGGAYVDLTVTDDDGVCAVTSDGVLDCFGAACPYGSRRWDLGDACHLDVLEAATAVSSGRNPCVRVGGEWRCWGINTSGEIDPSNGSARLNTPSPIPVPSEDVVAVAPGWTHACALHDDGAASCWGSSYHGELGRGEGKLLNRRYVLSTHAPNPTGFSLGDNHGCVADSPAPRCWGTFTTGTSPFQRGSVAGVQIPAAAGVTHLASGGEDACGLRPGAVVCFGDKHNDPPLVVALADVHTVTVGARFGCGVVGAERKLWCWGWDGNIARPADAPQGLGDDEPAVIDGAAPVVAAAAGDRHLCWVREGGALFCRGTHLYDHAGETRNNPVEPLALGTFPGVQALAAGDYATCMLVEGTVSCWGSNAFGQLGNGSWEDPSGLAKVKLAAPAIAIALARRHACAVTEDGAVWCWGQNEDGELGTGDRLAAHTPRRVLGVERAVNVVVGRAGSCAIRADGEVVCWGDLATDLFEPKEREAVFAAARVVALGVTVPAPKLARIVLPKE